MSDTPQDVEQADIYLKLPTSEQRDSRLMQLPIEIRTMILQLLLVHDGPLSARRPQKKRESPVPDSSSIYYHDFSPPQDHVIKHATQSHEELCHPYDLHPALLATCQRLFDEGFPLLCGANTLGFQFNRDGVVLYADPDMPVQEWDKTSCQRKTCAQVEKLLSRFNSIHVDVLCSLDDEQILKDMILGMGDALGGKAVKVNLDQAWTEEPMDCEVLKCVQDLLRFFKLIRCQTFEVTNPGFDQSSVSEIVMIVTSDQPVVNLWPSLCDLKDFFVDQSLFCYRCRRCCGTFNDFYDDGRYDQLEQAASDFDVAEFRRIRAAWMEEVEENHRRRWQVALRHDELHGTTQVPRI